MGEKALTDEPVYAGEPVLAVAAVDEETAARRHRGHPRRLGAAALRRRSAGEPASRRPEPARRGQHLGPRRRPSRASRRGPLEVQPLKWTAEDFAEYDQGKMPMGKPQVEWSYGDVEAGFKNAALVLDETFSMANNQHHVLEPRTALAYWRNGKLYMHTGTQSAVQTVASISRWMRARAENVVLITEYTGGGFGSRATGAVICMIPALLAKKANAPVMMRITREEEQYIGGIRPGVHGRVKAGFAKDGRLLALDMFLIGENSAYEAQGDAAGGGRFVSLLYQPVAMRSRADHGAHQHAAAARAEPAGRAAGAS